MSKLFCQVHAAIFHSFSLLYVHNFFLTSVFFGFILLHTIYFVEMINIVQNES